MSRFPLITRNPEVFTFAAEGRRLVRRAIAWQAAAVAVAALAFLAKGADWALAVALGGGAVAVGGWLASVIALGGGANPGMVALMRLVAGTGMKWAVIVGALLFGMAGAGLPPLPMVLGVIVALAAQMVAMAGSPARR